MTIDPLDRIADAIRAVVPDAFVERWATAQGTTGLLVPLDQQAAKQSGRARAPLLSMLCYDPPPCPDRPGRCFSFGWSFRPSGHPTASGYHDEAEVVRHAVAWLRGELPVEPARPYVTGEQRERDLAEFAEWSHLLKADVAALARERITAVNPLLDREDAAAPSQGGLFGDLP